MSISVTLVVIKVSLFHSSLDKLDRVLTFNSTGNCMRYLFISLAYLLFSSFAYSAELWVSKSGSNSTCGSTEASACNSIQLAINEAQAGDIIYITEGTYIEDTSNSPYTDKCDFFGPVYSLCFKNSGTESDPIVVTAAPGDENKVVIDSEGVRLGLYTGRQNYVHIKNLNFTNSYVHAIGSHGQIFNEVAAEHLLAIGWLIENNNITNTAGDFGLNISGIAPWGTKDWIIRNNYISGVSTIDSTRPANCIQAYGVINILIEYNTLTDCANGIFWKDHYIANDARDHIFESEIRYNDIQAFEVGVLLGIRGTDTVEAGDNHIHHNIIRGFSNRAIDAGLSGAAGPSGDLIIEHNLVIAANTSAGFIASSGMETVSSNGNISFVDNQHYQLRYETEKMSVLTDVDYNIYGTSFKAYLDRYGPSAKEFRSLEEWQEANTSLYLSASAATLDDASIQASLLDVVDPSNNFKYPANSPAKNFMANGTNAGPYQYENETIGSSRIKPSGPGTVIYKVQ